MEFILNLIELLISEAIQENRRVCFGKLNKLLNLTKWLNLLHERKSCNQRRQKEFFFVVEKMEYFSYGKMQFMGNANKAV